MRSKTDFARTCFEKGVVSQTEDKGPSYRAMEAYLRSRPSRPPTALTWDAFLNFDEFKTMNMEESPGGITRDFVSSFKRHLFFFLRLVRSYRLRDGLQVTFNLPATILCCMAESPAPLIWERNVDNAALLRDRDNKEWSKVSF
jgi:hypothetical protein